MITGITFEVPNKQGYLLRDILIPIDVSAFNWLVKDEEAYYVVDGELGEPLFNHKTLHLEGQLLQKKIEEQLSYVIFANLKAFPKGSVPKGLEMYKDFKESDCEFVLLIVDGTFVTVYCKDNVLSETLFYHAKRKGYLEVAYLTDENDERTGLPVW
ncbi:DUF2691 family protein [Anaerobacillus sp. 1_MG-2023]|uniref:DUF2691 family protein n=1 Tax=Anaerobacillus sp. 1_MG-2023 TaxID=3062655 RepID=UPI0026E2D697|nr:DUF2691 family protein [Anaerobacillus sp. 1_MG-2023]MDO6654339.1 DUF2691 family protein [Anaerobacillus sp. 1_MG-2023]